MKISTIAVFLSAFVLVGCVSRSSSTNTTSHVPSEFKAYIGGFFGSSYTLEFFPPSTLRYTHTSRGENIEMSETQFAPEHWEDVFLRLQGAGVYRWRSKYVRTDISDGTQWSFEYATSSRRQKIWGDNRYPEYGEFREFLSLISDMAGGKKFE